MRKGSLANSAAVAVFAAALGFDCFGSAEAQHIIIPQPIPPQFNFPSPAATINSWIASGNTDAIRGHAWDLWAGLTANSGQMSGGQELPIWETWYGSDDVFPPSAPTSAGGLMAFVASKPRLLRDFVSPHQFHHNVVRGAAAAAGQDTASQVVSFNKFDPAAATFIAAPQPGPNGQIFSYNKQASLQALNAAWPAGASGQTRGTNDFPIEAMELKPVFKFVKATGLTPQPLWQGPAGATNPANPTPGTWTTCVLIDPAGTGGIRPATAAEISQAQNVGPLACKTYLYGPLSLFYSFKMTAEEAKAFASAQGGSPSAGDYAVLVAMHVNSKEIPFWTWQTFWWQPGADAPNGFPGTKAGLPASVASPWNNYATCANYDQTTTPGGPTMQVCFNPYLETSPGIPVGITSNCMSCHGTARILANQDNETYPSAYNAPISFFQDTTYFNSISTHTDFSWAIPSAP
jgi:hypothetical protein